MSAHTALTACFVVVLWLFASESRRGGGNSIGTWIVLCWLAILGTRPVSSWLEQGSEMSSTDDYLEGSPIDRNVFLLLLGAGVVLLFYRRVNWRLLRTRNFWVFCLFLYFGVSALWSDYPFVSFKRWIKDLGNVVMVLVVLTEKEQ